MQAIESLACPQPLAVHYHEAAHAVLATVLAESHCKSAVVDTAISGWACAYSRRAYSDMLVTMAGPVSEIAIAIKALPADTKPSAVAEHIEGFMRREDWQEGATLDVEEFEILLAATFGRRASWHVPHIGRQVYELVLTLWEPIAAVANRLERGWVGHEEILKIVDEARWTLPRHLRALVKRKYVRRLAPVAR